MKPLVKASDLVNCSPLVQQSMNTFLFKINDLIELKAKFRVTQEVATSYTDTLLPNSQKQTANATVI